jgi:glutamate-ammonia-ligase adenylyltransferase
LLAVLGDRRPADAVLLRCEDRERCVRLYRGILIRAAMAIEHGAMEMESRLGDALLRVPSPERALVHLDRVLEASLSPSGLLGQFLRAPRLLSDVLFLISSSQWLADTLVREAGLFRWLLVSDALAQAPSHAAIRASARAAVCRSDRTASRINALRRFQRRELLRIAAADLLGRKGLSQVVEELSALADAVVTVVLEEALATIARRHGRPVRARIAIIALGKLGGNELNYSSDIDLMVVYAGAIDEHDDVIAVVKEMLRVLTEHSVEGMLYRTDLRLRPDGAAGALALSLPATIAYYEQRGAAWERQMLLRARVCAGDAALAEEFLHRITPFVFPHGLRQPPSVLLADVRARLAMRWNADADVKHMRGGIRHIEFSLQLLQLLHGNRTALRTPGTLTTLAALTAEGLIVPEEEALLRDAYVFLRRVEHVLQLERFEQTHTLPSRDVDLWCVAWALGFTDVEDFRRRIARVREHVDRICGVILEDEKQCDPSDPHAPIARAILDGRGSAPRTATERARLARLLPTLLEEARETTQPREALSGVESFLHTASDSGAVTLLEHPRARRLLLSLAALAPVTLRTLERDPFSLELVLSGWDESRLDARRLQRVVTTSALAGLLFADHDMREFNDALTRTADTLLTRALVRRFDGSIPFAVVAMGTYGSMELIPGSDLDVIFLHAGDGADDHERAQQLARDLITDMRGEGVPPLYELDARLRPEGSGAPLAVSLDTWRRYLRDRALPWERQSLLRARVAVGDTSLATEILSVIATQRTSIPLTRDDVETIRAMRLKMEPENRFRRQDFIDIKKSAGGLVDAEFAAQLLQLAMPALSSGTTTGQTLADAAPKFPDVADAAMELVAHHEYLRRVQLFLRLQIGTPSNLLPDGSEERRRLAAAMRAADPDVWFDELRARMARARRNYSRILDAVSSTAAS